MPVSFDNRGRRGVRASDPLSHKIRWLLYEVRGIGTSIWGMQCMNPADLAEVSEHLVKALRGQPDPRPGEKDD